MRSEIRATRNLGKRRAKRKKWKPTVLADGRGTGERWKHRLAPDQWTRAGEVVAALNRPDPATYATWLRAHAIFDALQPKRAQLHRTVVTPEGFDPGSTGVNESEPPSTGARERRLPAAGGLAAAKRIFENWALELARNGIEIRLGWPVDHRNFIYSNNPGGNAYIACFPLFNDGGWQLIKRCHGCAKWTVNMGDGSYKRFCSPKCRTEWWNRERDRRRAAPQAAKAAAAQQREAR